MKTRIITWLITLPAIAFLLTGCTTSFPGKNLEPVAGFPEVTAPKSIYVDLAFTGELNGEPWTLADEHNTTFLKERCISHLQASNMFGEIVTSQKNADLILYAALVNSREANPTRKLWSNLTLTIFPFKSTDTFHLQAVIKNVASGERKTIKLKEDITYWQELLFTPLALFKSSNNAMDDCRTRLFDNLCLEIHKSGLID